MSKKFVHPNIVRSVATIPCHCFTNLLKSTKICPHQVFRFLPGAENKNSVCQMSRNNVGSCTVYPFFPLTVEIDQKNHVSISTSFHFPYMNRLEQFKHFWPSSSLRKHHHLPGLSKL